MTFIRNQLVIALLLLSLSCSADSDGLRSTTDAMRAELVSLADQQYGNFQLCEVFSQNRNDVDFLSSRLTEKLLAEKQNIERSEFYIKEVEDGTKIHTGFVVISYSSPKAAQAAEKGIENRGFLRNTKIMTPYRLMTKGNEIIIVYSESAADEFAISLLEELVELDGLSAN